MCINPRVMNNGVSVACRKCWQCRENAINDWVGRCIAEGKTAAATRAVTLTYGRDEFGNSDHVRASVLTYSDVQKWIKLLRRHNHPCRYFVVGEFGGAKGRAHWHIVLFFEGSMPKHELDTQCLVQARWEHGYSHWTKPSHEAIRYNCKYIQKDLRDAERQQQIGMSKKPPLGAHYFSELARNYVRQGLAPQHPEYSFPDVRNKHGEIIKFRLRNASLDLFCEGFIRQWKEHRGGHPPVSQLLEEYADRKARYLADVNPQPFRPMLQKPWIEVPEDCEMLFSESHNTWYYLDRGKRLFWSFDLRGRRSWQSVVRTEAQADALREASERQSGSEIYLDRTRGR